MDILELLIAERDKLERAIGALQDENESQPQRRGRPPGRAKKERPEHKPRSAASRKAQAAKMKAYWAAKRRNAKVKQPPKKKPLLVKAAA